MKTIVVSIRKNWMDKFLSGEKTTEVRKTFPKCFDTLGNVEPFTVLFYETKADGGAGAIVAKAICNGYVECTRAMVYDYDPDVQKELAIPFAQECIDKAEQFLHDSCLTRDEIKHYAESYWKKCVGPWGKVLYGWKISDVQPYIVSLKDVGLNVAPQSWGYAT